MPDAAPPIVRRVLAGWLTAVGTVGTAVVSVFLVGRDVYDRRRRADMERRAQAAQVSLGEPQSTGTNSMANRPGHFQVTYQLVVANGSDQPVSECEVTVTVVLVGQDPSGLSPHLQTQQLGRVLPGAERPAGFQFQLPGEPTEGAAEHVATSELTFTDAARLRWRRDADHVLHELQHEPGVTARRRRPPAR